MPVAADGKIVCSVCNEAVPGSKTVRPSVIAGTELIVDGTAQAGIRIHAAGDFVEQRV